MRRRWKVLAGSVGALFVVAMGTSEYAYRYGLDTLNELPEPPTDTVSAAVAQLAWLEFEGAGPISVQPTGPLRYAMRLVFDGSRRANALPATAGHRIATFCARHLIVEQHPGSPRPVEFNLAMASLSIWLSRNWSTGQIVACALNGGYYGHGFVGIDAAARGYLEKPATDLSYADAAILMVALRGPYFDPVCNPTVVLSEAHLLMARLAQQAALGGRPEELIMGEFPDRLTDGRRGECSGDDRPT